ncbi:MAG: PAS domain S-box protein, partial [Gallionellaceae bacterium]
MRPIGRRISGKTGEAQLILLVMKMSQVGYDKDGVTRGSPSPGKPQGCVMSKKPNKQNPPRAEADQGIRESEERLRAIINQAIVGIVQADVTGHITFVNDHYCEITGYPREELLGKRWLDLTHPDDISQNMELFDKIVREDQPFSFEKRYVRKNGESVWVSIGASMLYSADREVIGGMAVVVDISKRKRAEELLRKSSGEIADLYNHAPCGYHSLDKDGVIRRINDTELAWLGYARDEVVGKMKWTDLITSASQQMFRENFPGFMKRGFVHDLEFEMIRKDGTVFFALVNATAIYDPSGDYLMSRSTLQDITKRKAAESARAKSDERARLAISAANLALWDYDLVTGSVYLSDGWSRLLGGEQQPTFTTIQALTMLVPEEEQHMVRNAILRAVKGHVSSSYQVTHRVRKPDGEYIWVLSEGRVTERAPDGQALRMIGTNRDITDRKKLEKEIQERHNEMEELQKLHVAAQTAAAIAHELNQPLLAIASYSGAARMLLQAGKPDLDKIRNAVEASERQAQRAGQSIRELLEFLSM